MFQRRLCPLLLALAIGCAEERPAINRVQPNALKKAIFVGPDYQSTLDDPEYYYHATLVDVGYGAAQDGLFTSTYAQPVSRIRWQITEDELIGRIAYERIEGSDGKGTGGPTQNGTIAAVFKIESHFDIVNAYNPTTGEQLNILEENESDRPWFEREYIRIDWSKNLNTDGYDFDMLSMLRVYGGVEYEEIAFDVTDPNQPDAPYFDDAGGYFDVTTRAFAKPKMIDLRHLGWGIDSFPACMLPAEFTGGTEPHGSCNPVELTIRHSFRKVVDNDYEPADWDGYRFQAYGAFTTERSGYLRNYGMSDQQWHRFIDRYNLWDRSHFYTDPAAMTGEKACFTPAATPFGADPHRDVDGNGTEDECEDAGKGSRCDTFRQRCTLPYAQRNVRPVPWYVTNGSDLDYYTGTRDATHEWDVALRVAVRSAQYAECVRVGGSSEECKGKFPVYSGQQEDNEDAIALAMEVDDCREGLAHAGRDCVALADEIGQKRGLSPEVISIAKMDEVVALCHSPVEANDPVACGGPRLPAGTSSRECQDAWKAPMSETAIACKSALNVRLGDLRYHTVNLVKTPQSPSPWGIMVDAVDPLTGEKISASINVWTYVNDLWSQGVIDTARYIKGELQTGDITEGEYIRKWAVAAESGSSGGMAGMMTREARDAKLAEFTGRAGGEALPQASAEMKFAAAALNKEIATVRASLEAPSTNRPLYQARMAQARGTEFEAQLLTPNIQKLFGIESLPHSETAMDQASMLRGGNPSFQRDYHNLREVALAERGACIMEEAPAPLSITGLTDVLEAKFGKFDPKEDAGTQQVRAERMRRYVSQRAHYAVIVHEMGHSVGLRHNFVSSSDAFNYRPQYWQLRTKNGAVDDECEDLQDAKGAESCIGPRYFDPITKGERDNMLWMFMQSSVMDYAGEPTQDLVGLGAYDFAAAKMFYGETVSVYESSSLDIKAGKSTGLLAKMDNFGGILGFQWRTGTGPQGSDDVHYSRLQDVFDLISDCKTVDASLWRPASWNDETQGAWHPVLDGHIVTVDGQTTRCRSQPVDYVPWTSLRTPTGPESGGGYRGGPSVDLKGRVRVPHGFGTDNWADLGNLAVYRHDNGADPYELVDFFITQQEVGHIFDNYRRGRKSFSVRGAVNRTLGRYNEKMRDAAKGLGLYKNIYADFSAAQGYNFDDFWPAIAPSFFRENIIASGLAFDHFARQLARPEHGEHFRAKGDPVLRSSRDYIGNPGDTEVVIPNGATGLYEDVGIGGRPIENELASDKGEYDSSYTTNAGSYYEKLYTAMLMTESVDNFISSSRTDFLDGRYRSVSIADLFPDGYRRWLANNLTGDDFIKGPRVAATKSGTPVVDDDGYPKYPIAWTSWWKPEPEACVPRSGTNVCWTYGDEDLGFSSDPAVKGMAAIDPQVGWEQQKFLIAWTLLYLPENQKQPWLDQLRIWELGKDADPGFENRIELHDPTGKVYVAKTFGKETIFGKTVQRGVAARIVEYANALVAQAYETTDGPDKDGDGEPDWSIPVLGPAGTPLVKWDERVAAINELGQVIPSGKVGCNAESNLLCECEANLACIELQRYSEVPYFLRQAIGAYGLDLGKPKGMY